MGKPTHDHERDDDDAHGYHHDDRDDRNEDCTYFGHDHGK